MSCGDIYNNILFCGCVDGNMLAFNLDTMECMYGYGADPKGSCDVIKYFESQNCIVAGGESGQLLKIKF